MAMLAGMPEEMLASVSDCWKQRLNQRLAS